MEKTIDEKIIAQRKRQLQKEEERLEAEIKSLRSYPDFDYGYSDDDNAAEVELFQNRLGAVASLDKALKEVRETLKRIEEGKFGVCDLCGGSIEDARLQIAPETAYCAKCANLKRARR